ncbi:unnamed protein product [Diplocarpon coronariae]
MGRMYDVIVLEPTSSDIGIKTVKHVSALLRKDLRWAVAGQNGGEMENCVEGLKGTIKEGNTLPSIEICSGVKEEMQELVKKTKILINVSEVNDGRGEILIEACAGYGTHYLDTANDIHWLGGMIRKYHDVARENRAIIMSHISVENTPQDLLTICAVMQLRTKLNLRTREIVCSINESSFPPTSTSSSHALPSPLSATTPISAPRSPRHPPLNPWFLSLVRGRTATPGTNRLGLRRELTLGMLAPSHTLASQQTRVLVHRGWALQQEGRWYGEGFYYNEYYRVTSSNVGLTGWVKRLRAGYRKASLVAADPATPIISLRAIAIADQDGAFPDRALSEFSYHGSAPDLVAAFLAQGAATILYTRGLVARVGGGGVLTPAVLGMDFVERLSRVGVEIGGELI